MNRFEVDGLPLATLYAGTDLGGRVSELGFAIGVNAFLHAGRALGSVKAFKAAMQAVVAHGAIAAAVAGLLVEHRRDLGGHLISRDLVRMREVRAGELRTVQERRKRMCRGSWVVGGNIVCGVGKLRGGSQRDQNQSDTTEKTLHSLDNTVISQGCVAAGSALKKKGGTSGVLTRAGRPVTQLALERLAFEKILRITNFVNRSVETVAQIHASIQIYVGLSGDNPEFWLKFSAIATSFAVIPSASWVTRVRRTRL